MRKLINNFVNASPLELVAQTHPSFQCGPIIHIKQDCGSLYFQHSLTLTQAREMAAALVELADSFEEVASSAEEVAA